jgi:D-alanyl-D-alanine carboxypeptidase/D-alanyl-D-alanine-endopeptidase (penicillin-binding protein 4)
MSSRNSAALVGLAVSLLARSLLAQSPLASLQHDIDVVIGVPALERAFWGVLVKPVDREEALYALNPGKLMMPASTMKVVTLAAAAERLGWDYTFSTRLFAAGPIDNGALHGDLIVVGSGDPSIDDWDGKATLLFADWAARLKAAGVSRIDGRVVGDDNAFDDDGLGQGWAWDDIAASFAASVSALQFNEGSVQLRLAPGPSVGASASVTLTPDYSGLTLMNLVTTGPAGSTPAIARRRFPGTSRLELRGTIPVRARPFFETASVDNPTLYFVTALRRSLTANGIDVQGPAVDIDDLVAPPSRVGAPLVTHLSPPLSMLATTMMKLSQNLYAETLLRSVGIEGTGRDTVTGRANTADAAGKPGSVEAGRNAVRSVLQSWNIDSTTVVQADGSGLSRYNFITPDAMVAILTHLNRDERLRGAFLATLPVAGRSGTLENRMKGTAAEGNARVKTGSLTGVRAMAGYVRSGDGETLAFAIFANNYENSSSVVNAACDAIIVRLAAFRR